MNHVLLLDFDQCLAKLNRDAAAKRVTKRLVEMLGTRGNQMGKEFTEVYNKIDLILHGKKGPEFAALKEKINSYKVKVPEKLANENINFMWSRELWIKYLSDKYNLEIDNQAAVSIIRDYWDAVASNSPLLWEAREFLGKTDAKKVFIITGSDKTLVVENGSLKYDPKTAEKRKISRILRQGLTMLPKSHIITGDPYDKMTDKFWGVVMKRTGIKKASQGIIVEDSLPVILSGTKFGFKGYLLDRRKFYDKKDVEKQIDGYITKLNSVFHA